MSTDRFKDGKLRREAFLRDRGVCAMCGFDTQVIEGLGLTWLYRPAFTDKELEARRYVIWCWLSAYGFLKVRKRALWEADHIVPVAEGGGGCGLENIRTLCAWCHDKVSATLRRKLAKAKPKKPRQKFYTVEQILKLRAKGLL